MSMESAGMHNPIEENNATLEQLSFKQKVESQVQSVLDIVNNEELVKNEELRVGAVQTLQKLIQEVEGMRSSMPEYVEEVKPQLEIAFGTLNQESGINETAVESVIASLLMVKRASQFESASDMLQSQTIQ